MKKIFTVNDYLKQQYNGKLYKISLDGGFTCPNRDGRLDTRGCIFCSQGGSGDFAGNRNDAISDQIEKGKQQILSKAKNVIGYIAYFQAFTNTYAPINVLREKYFEAVVNTDIKIISIATRPDCINEEVLALLSEINQIKPVWVELGLQTTKEDSVEFIRRGYANNVYKEAVEKLRRVGIKVITHIILGLPGESREDMRSSIDYAVSCDTWGIKLQLLNILKNTDLLEVYEKNPWEIMSLEEYGTLLMDCIKQIPDGVVLHRITGDGPKSILVEPKWTSDKKRVLNYLNKLFKEEGLL